MCRAKCTAHVLSPLTASQPGLVARVTKTLEDIGHPRSRETPRDALCDRVDMVEASPAAAVGVEGDTDDEIGARGGLPGDPSGQLSREMVDRKPDRDARAKGTPSAFETGNPSPNGAFVASQRAAMM